MFSCVGLTILGDTPDKSADCSGDRVDEILQWLRDHGSGVQQPWVAIDDLDLLTMNPKLSPRHFVRTRDSIGLTLDNAERAIELLHRQREERKLAGTGAGKGRSVGAGLLVVG